MNYQIVRLTDRETEVLADLREQAESWAEENFWCVYLDNCKFRNTPGWAGVLSSLTKKGFYEPDSDTERKNSFGFVLMDSEEN